MENILAKAELVNGNLFQGRDYGDIPLSFFWVNVKPGSGPRLHKHPYEEIFVIQEGYATFTVGEQTIEVAEGHILIGPANVPHKFLNSGERILRMVNLQPNKEMLVEWLEP